MKTAESRRRKTSKVGKIDRERGCVLAVNQNGHHGKSQKGCFGYASGKREKKS